MGKPLGSFVCFAPLQLPTHTPGGGPWMAFPQDTPGPNCYFLSEQEVSAMLLMVADSVFLDE